MVTISGRVKQFLKNTTNITNTIVLSFVTNGNVKEVSFLLRETFFSSRDNIQVIFRKIQFVIKK